MANIFKSETHEHLEQVNIHLRTQLLCQPDQEDQEIKTGGAWVIEQQ